MAKGYVLNTPRRKNPSSGTRRGVTMVNPRPRASASRWGHESVLPRRYSRRERTRAAWENPSPRKSSRRSSNPVQGKIVESGKSPKARKNSATKQVSGRVVPNKKAGSYARRANTGRRKSVSKNTVSGRVVKTSRNASTSKRASSASPKRNSTRSRPQSRNAAGKKKSVATKKKATKRNPRKVTVKVPAKRTRSGKIVRKAYSYKRAAKPKRKTATRRKTTTRRRNPAPKRNTRTGRMVANKKKRITANKTVRWRTDVHPSTGKRGILGTPMTMAERKKWTSRGFQRAKQKAERAQRVKATAGKKRAPGVKGAAAKGHWRQGVVHPVTGRLVGGRPMSERDRKLFKTDGTTRKGIGPAAVNAAYGLKPSAAKKAKPTRRKTVAAKPKKRKTTAKKRRRTTGKRYRVRKPGGGTYLRRYPTKRRKTAKKKTARRGKTITVKVPAKRSRSGKILRKAYSYKRKATTTKKRKPAKRKTAKRKTARRYRVRKPGGGTYLRRYPTKRRKATKKRATKKAKRGKARRYRVRKPGGGTYLRRYPTKRRKATKKRATKKAKRGKARRYRVRKPGGGTYLRRYPRRKAKGRKRTYSRKRSNGRRKGKIVRVKPYTRADGVRVKGYSYRLKKTGSRKGKITRNPHKRKKVRVKPYSYTRRKPRRKRVKVPGGRRNQWYPHHYGGKWISQAKAKKLGLLTKREQRAMMRNGGHAAMVTNPEALAMLPTSEQLMSVGKAAGLGFVGFGAAVAAGRALTNVTAISQHLGNWTSVVGNVAAGLGFWALASLMPENEKLQAMKPFVAAGAGMAALVNIMLNLVASRTVPSNYAAWIMPGAGAAEAAPAAIVEPTNGMLPIAPQAMVTNGNGNGNGLVNGNGNGLVNGNGLPPELEAEGTAGFGQIDIYEAALDGVGGIEEELELELDRMSGMGGDQGGIFEGGKAGVLSGMDGTGEYLEVPMSEYLEVPMSGMGANVEEAFAGGGSGGVSEYLEVPMSGMGAQVEEAYAGMNEYLEVPMSGMGAQVEEAYAGMNEYLEVPMSGMGAMVEEAYAGMGQEPSVAAVEQSIRTRPLMPGFKQAVAKMVRERIAAGLPLDDAFYSKLGRAAAGLARKKFAQRVRQVSGRPAHLPMEPWKPPLLRRSAPMYRRPVRDPAPGRIPGVAEPIPTHGPKGGDEGIFTGGEDEGIF